MFRLVVLVILIACVLGSAKPDVIKKSIEPTVVALDFKKIAIKELLEFIAEEMNYNIVIAESVTGSVTVHLKKVTWMQALDTVLEITGFVKRIESNTIFVGTPASFAARQASLQQAVPLKCARIKLQHTDAHQIYTILKSQSELLSEDAKVACNLQKNSLWLRESADNLPLVIDYIHELDVAEKQLVITAKIINLNNKQKCELGIKFSATPMQKECKSTPGDNANAFKFAIINMAQNQILNLELDALEKSGHSHVVADPTIVTQNRKTATIEAGEDIPYQEKTSSGATSVTFKKAALSLKVTPTVLPDNRIVLDLEINQNKVLPLSINGTPAIQTQELKTQVTVRSDEAVILGGIYEAEHANLITAMPVLGHIPGIGSLLSHHDNEQLKSELFVIISPHIMN